MKRLFRFLWELAAKDPWRKLGAILLAYGLWLYVNQRITGEINYMMEIRPTKTRSWESEPGVLYVRVPADRLLRLPFNKLHITLRGPNQELFALPKQLTAFFDPGEGDFDKARMAGKAIRWDPPHVGSLLKEMIPDPVELSFERVERHTLSLESKMLDLEGAPPEGFFLDRDKTEFFPSNIVLVGARSAVEKLKTGGFRSLFATIALRKEDANPTQRFQLALHPDLLREGLALESGRGAFVQLSIRPKTVTIPFKARIWPIAPGEEGKRFLDLYRIQGSSENVNWVEENWIAEIPVLLGNELNEAWIQKNVRFFVDFSAIPRGPEGGEELSSVRLEVFFRLNLETQDRMKFSGIQFRPADPGKNKIVVEKRAPKNGG